MHRPAVRRPRPRSNPTGSRIGMAAVAVVALLAMMPALGIPSAHASGPVAQLTPTELTFPATPTGSRSETQSVTLTNAGDGPLTVHSVRTAALGSSSPFEIMAHDCTGRSLGVGEACTVDIAFQPDTAGGVTGELTFAHDAPGSPHIVALSGQGLAAYPVAKASPRVVEFGTIGEYFESRRTGVRRLQNRVQLLPNPLVPGARGVLPGRRQLSAHRARSPIRTAELLHQRPPLARTCDPLGLRCAGGP